MRELLEKYPYTMWQSVVAKGETVLGYLQWVQEKQLLEMPAESELDRLERLAHNRRTAWTVKKC